MVPPAAPQPAAASSPRGQWAALRSLLPHLWPAGETELKARVVVASTCLILAKVTNLYVPILFKRMVDALGVTGTAIALPLGLLAAYGLARVLAQLWPGGAEQVLLLDEPTSALDPLHQHTTLHAVREFAGRGAAVLVILHDLNLAARYCDRLLLLHDGRPHLFGTPDEVLRAEPLRQVFGPDVLVQRHPERGHPLIVAR